MNTVDCRLTCLRRIKFQKDVERLEGRGQEGVGADGFRGANVVILRDDVIDLCELLLCFVCVCVCVRVCYLFFCETSGSLSTCCLSLFVSPTLMKGIHNS